MGRLIDLDDLLDAGDVAKVLGLADRRGTAVYRGRYADFPEPVVERGGCHLWHRADIDAWAASRAERRGPVRDAETSVQRVLEGGGEP